MRKTSELRREWLGAFAALTLLLVLLLGLFGEGFGMISRAEGQGTVIVTAATIRREANVDSEAIGSVVQGKTININSEVTGSDGMIWYQVNVDSNTLGYIRSDLVEKSGEGADQPPAAYNPTVEVTDVQPQSASVVGDQIRIRSDASTSAEFVAIVKSDVALTVTGQATGADGNLWYRVTFLENGAEVTGFVRNDFVTLGGELVPSDGTAPAEGDTQGQDQPQEPQTQPSADQPYGIQNEDGEWYLQNYEADEQYKIPELIKAGEENGKLYEASLKTMKGQKIAIIVLLILLIAAILAATMLFFKVRDVMDEAYFSAVEKETIRERKAAGSGNRPSKRVMQTVGEDEPAAPAGKQRQPGSRSMPAGAGRPGAAQGQPARQPAGRQQSSGQARPTGAQSQPARQAGTQNQPGRQNAAKSQAHTAAAQNPSQNRSTGSVARQPVPQGEAARQSQPVRQGKPQGAKNQGSVQSRAAGAQVRGSGREDRMEQPNPGWKSRNFMTEDDDEFEFEFLNWDGEENS